MYTFLIDEMGQIFKCAFGVWYYADVDEYLDGGFRAKFKDYNSKFYKCFLPSCNSCYSYARNHNVTVKPD